MLQVQIVHGNYRLLPSSCKCNAILNEMLQSTIEVEQSLQWVRIVILYAFTLLPVGYIERMEYNVSDIENLMYAGPILVLLFRKLLRIYKDIDEGHFG
jgi:hypothetical protein